MSDFWSRFKEIEAQAAATADGAAFIAAGFALHANGGNLTAWRKRLGAHRELLITDDEGCSHDLAPPSDDFVDSYAVGLHDSTNGGDTLESKSGLRTAAEAIAAAKEIESGLVAYLAGQFADRVHDYTPPEQWAELCQKNDSPEYSDSCASHDYMDSNMEMDAVWRAAFGVGVNLDDSEDGEADRRFWGAVWDAAKRGWLSEKAQLGARYVALVGYDPFADDPTISVETVRQTIAELER